MISHVAQYVVGGLIAALIVVAIADLVCEVRDYIKEPRL